MVQWPVRLDLDISSWHCTLWSNKLCDGLDALTLLWSDTLIQLFEILENKTKLALLYNIYTKDLQKISSKN